MDEILLLSLVPLQAINFVLLLLRLPKSQESQLTLTYLNGVSNLGENHFAITIWDSGFGV